jgi:Fic family protein
MLFNQIFTKVNHPVDSRIYAENTARNYLNELAKKQVVEKKTIQGHHYYLNTELYRILSE